MIGSLLSARSFSRVGVASLRSYWWVAGRVCRARATGLVLAAFVAARVGGACASPGIAVSATRMALAALSTFSISKNRHTRKKSISTVYPPPFFRFFKEYCSSYLGMNELHVGRSAPRQALLCIRLAYDTDAVKVLLWRNDKELAKKSPAILWFL